MGYLFLTLSVLSGAIKGFFAKKISDKTSGLKSAVFSNFIRMLFCIPIGLLFVLFDGGASQLSVSKEVLFVALLSGIATSAFIVSWLLAVQKSAYTAMDAFLSMGMLVPILLSGVFYNETVAISQIIGLILLLGAVVLMSVYTNQIKEKLPWRSILLLCFVGLANGATDFLQKVFTHTSTGVPASVFNFYTYVFSAIILCAFFFLLKEKKQDGVAKEQTTEQKPTFNKQKLAYIAVMAVFLFCNSYFKTLAATFLPAVRLYPLSQGTALALSMLMSALFFKEKIKPLCVVGAIILFIGLLFLNVIVF
ncbi:MAG: EamA family transporter [Clostridia bacterium]|nr:EamA family transporter [Clostridia bacterium]